MPPPFIVIEHGQPRVEDRLAVPRANRLGVMHRFWDALRAFDQDSEYRLAVRDAPSFGWLAQTLAATVYNPPVSLDGAWIVAGPYRPQSIVDLVRAGLEQDDDIIQQWFDADQVMKLLGAAGSFPAMVLAVRCIGGAHETDAAAREFAARVLESGWSEE